MNNIFPLGMLEHMNKMREDYAKQQAANRQWVLSAYDETFRLMLKWVEEYCKAYTKVTHDGGAIIVRDDDGKKVLTITKTKEHLEIRRFGQMDEIYGSGNAEKYVQDVKAIMLEITDLQPIDEVKGKWWMGWLTK